jgi:hypothetical protein
MFICNFKVFVLCIVCIITVIEGGRVLLEESRAYLGLNPLGLISHLLRGQVRHLLYIRRGDVSI